MSNVVILKLISGEELIATKNDSEYSRIRVFQMNYDQTGNVRAGLVPYIIVAPDAVIKDFNKNAIVAEIDAPLEVEKSYREATSGISLMR